MLVVRKINAIKINIIQMTQRTRLRPAAITTARYLQAEPRWHALTEFSIDSAPKPQHWIKVPGIESRSIAPPDYVFHQKAPQR